MKLLFKNTFKKIGKSIGRFLSIMFIIALGISVFIGLRESTAGMLYTADDYYDRNNLMDFKVISTYGITDDDLKSLEDLCDIDRVVPSYSLDVISNGESIKIHALEGSMNNVSLIDGKMPKKASECLADYYNYKIGDTIKFEEDNGNLLIDQCKVVGLIKSVLYVRDEKGISTVGNGKLMSFVFVKKEVFKMKYYTEVYLISASSQEKNSYYDEYNEEIKSLKEELETLKPIRETIRYEEILKEANDNINKIKKELDKKINDSMVELNSSKAKLDSGLEELGNVKNVNVKKFEDNIKKLNDNKKLIFDALDTFGIDETKIDAYVSNLDGIIAGLKEELSHLEEDSDEYKKVNDNIIELEKNRQDLITMKSSLVEINSNLKTLNDSYKSFLNEIDSEEKELQSGYLEYEEGLNKLESAKIDASKEIEKARKALDDIEKPVWYLLDRTDNSGYISYKEDIVKVDAIAKILPIFFIIIVILMILNTLTRLIEEERNEIGILQSNGFSKLSIIFSYLIYVCSAGIFGIAIGMTIGYSIIPNIIYSAFLARYYVPKLITIVSPLPFSLVIGITLIIMVLVTSLACHKELKEVPASLLRPKPPKTGKKIVFENMKFIWNKLSFMSKTTIRNLFRYKKRIVMTILGVSGCTALLITGMGIKDSIDNISKLQYKDIIKYDAMYVLKENVSKMPSKLVDLYDDNGVVNPLLINQNAYTFSFDNKTEDVYVVVPSDLKVFNNYVNLKSTVTDKNIKINDKGAIITKQLAEHLKIKIGDSISIRNSDNELFILNVSDIVYNYVAHYIYISDNYYKEIFRKDITYNSVLANGKIDSKTKLSDYNLLMVNYTKDIIKTFDSFVNGLNKIIIMIIVFACFLAFIVLYNLTIINVSERKREIATFKVLGFYNKEISSYIYRETLILTILGVLLGLFLGVYLHRFVIATSETDNIMFLRNIEFLSYFLAAVITIFFSILVQLIVNHTLKNVDMIDSLKSVE